MDQDSKKPSAAPTWVRDAVGPASAEPYHIWKPRPLLRSILWKPATAGESTGRSSPAYETFIVQRALDALFSHVWSSPHETSAFGFLVGDLCECTESGGRYIIVNAAIPSRFSLKEQGEPQISTEANIALQLEVDRHKGVMVGWYHSHPKGSPQLSDQDLATHRSIFKEAWHTAVLVTTDSSRPEGAVFRQTEEGLDSELLPFFEQVSNESLMAKGRKRTRIDWQNFVTDAATVSDIAPRPDVQKPAIEDSRAEEEAVQEAAKATEQEAASVAAEEAAKAEEEAAQKAAALEAEQIAEAERAAEAARVTEVEAAKAAKEEAAQKAAVLEAEKIAEAERVSEAARVAETEAAKAAEAELTAALEAGQIAEAERAAETARVSETEAAKAAEEEAARVAAEEAAKAEVAKAAEAEQIAEAERAAEAARIAEVEAAKAAEEEAARVAAEEAAKAEEEAAQKAAALEAEKIAEAERAAEAARVAEVEAAKAVEEEAARVAAEEEAARKAAAAEAERAAKAEQAAMAAKAAEEARAAKEAAKAAAKAEKSERAAIAAEEKRAARAAKKADKDAKAATLREEKAARAAALEAEKAARAAEAEAERAARALEEEKSKAAALEADKVAALTKPETAEAPPPPPRRKVAGGARSMTVPQRARPEPRPELTQEVKIAAVATDRFATPPAEAPAGRTRGVMLGAAGLLIVVAVLGALVTVVRSGEGDALTAGAADPVEDFVAPPDGQIDVAAASEGGNVESAVEGSGGAQDATPPANQISRAVFEALGDNMLGVISTFYGQALRHDQGGTTCTQLQAAFVSVEEGWISYNVEGKARFQERLTGDLLERDDRLYAGVQDVEREFDRSGCARP